MWRNRVMQRRFRKMKCHKLMTDPVAFIEYVTGKKLYEYQKTILRMGGVERHRFFNSIIMDSMKRR